MSTPLTPLPPSPSRKPWEVLGVVVAVIVFVAAVLLFGSVLAQTLAAVWRWLAIAVLMVALLVVIGVGVNRRPDGFLIDTRYKLSLSRLQITLWTVLILSAYLTIALPRTLPGGMYDLTTVDPTTRQALQKLSPGKEPCFAGPSSEATITETAALAETCTPDPVGVTFPIEVIAALGISAASFAGSTLIQSVKKAQKVEVTALKPLQAKQLELERAQEDLKKARQELEEAQEAVNLARDMLDEIEAQLEALRAPGAAPVPEQIEELEARQELSEEAYSGAKENFQLARQAYSEAQARVETLTRELDEATQAAAVAMEGVLHKNTDPSQASWLDLFRGDEIGNYLLVDLSKVQMFFFTIVLVFAYGAAIYLLMQDPLALKNPLGVAFPPFSASLNGLLAISHAGYLTVKTVPHTAVASTPLLMEERR